MTTPPRTPYCWGCGADKSGLRFFLASWLCAACIKHLKGEQTA